MPSKVKPLIGPETVNTLPPETMDACRDHGEPAARLTEHVELYAGNPQGLPELGVDLNQAAEQLEDGGAKGSTNLLIPSWKP